MGALYVQVVDTQEKKPHPALAAALKNGLRSRGVLIGTTGEHSNMLKIRPPLAFTVNEVHHLVYDA